MYIALAGATQPSIPRTSSWRPSPPWQGPDKTAEASSRPTTYTTTAQATGFLYKFKLFPLRHPHLDMWSDGSVTRTDYGEGDDVPELRDIHPLTPRSHVSRSHRRDLWEDGGSLGSIHSTMTRELNAMVVSGSNAQQNGSSQYGNESGNGSGGEEPGEEAAAAETNPLAIVPTDPIPSPGHQSPNAGAGEDEGEAGEERLPPVHVVRREEVESKVAAWQTAEVAKINNRYKREEVIINGWESEQVEKAAAWLKKIERKLDKQKARATETMQNEIAKAQQKAAEKKASAEAKRGTKVARVLELANFMRAVGRPPSKRSFF